MLLSLTRTYTTLPNRSSVIGTVKRAPFLSYFPSENTIQTHQFSCTNPISNGYRPIQPDTNNFSYLFIKRKTHSKPPKMSKKVTSENVPPTHEGVGSVPSDSLAADSIRSGGAFAQGNPSASAGDSVSHNPRANPPGTAHQTHPTSQSLKHEDPEQGTKAATYAHAGQDLSDQSGPHGKNIKEGGFAGSGTEGGSMPEPGSKRDPGRVALNDMLASTGTAGKESAGRGSQQGVNTRLAETGQKGFGALGGDTEA